MTIADPLDGQPADQFETDGTVTIGPLPRGTTMIVVDAPPFAQTRLPDIVVTGTEPLLDGGVITIQLGAVLQADIVDENDAPVTAHDVWIEDAAPQSPLVFRPARTDPKGRALFDRLAPGRYRVWTKTKERCGNFVLSLARVVSVGTSDIRRARVVIGGKATFRVVSSLGPMIGKIVRVTPDTVARRHGNLNSSRCLRSRGGRRCLRPRRRRASARPARTDASRSRIFRPGRRTSRSGCSTRRM